MSIGKRRWSSTVNRRPEPLLFRHRDSSFIKPSEQFKLMKEIEMTRTEASRLPPRQQLVATDKWPIVGEKAARPSDDPWSLSVQGLVAQPQQWSLDELQAMPQITRTVDLHCVTRWSKYDVTFSGVRLLDLLVHADPDSTTRFVSFIARTDRSHSTSLAWDDLATLDPLVAWAVDGEPLPAIHGGPLRLITPGRYFYKSLKWLETIELLAVDRLGYWEADAGYHNHADPWKEERYVAGELTKQEAARLVASRDFQGQDLLGFQGSGRQLDGLRAAQAKMRDADFSEASLVGADFTGANLSNANFRGSQLTNARFCHADVEGADFGGASLADADFANASLFGASFIDPPDAVHRRSAVFGKDESTERRATGNVDRRATSLDQGGDGTSPPRLRRARPGEPPLAVRLHRLASQRLSVSASQRLCVSASQRLSGRRQPRRLARRATPVRTHPTDVKGHRPDRQYSVRRETTRTCGPQAVSCGLL